MVESNWVLPGIMLTVGLLVEVLGRKCFLYFFFSKRFFILYIFNEWVWDFIKWSCRETWCLVTSGQIQAMSPGVPRHKDVEIWNRKEKGQLRQSCYSRNQSIDFHSLSISIIKFHCFSKVVLASFSFLHSFSMSFNEMIRNLWFELLSTETLLLPCM